MGDHLALLILHRHRACGGAVFDGFAIDAHLTLALGVEQLRDRSLGRIVLFNVTIGDGALGRSPGEQRKQ